MLSNSISEFLQLKGNILSDTQECMKVMAREYEAESFFLGLGGSCIRESTIYKFKISHVVKNLISEAWSYETVSSARSHIVTSKFNAALTCLDEAVKLTNNISTALLERAVILFHSNHFLTALKDIDKISENDPRCSKVQAFRQSILSHLTPLDMSTTTDNKVTRNCFRSLDIHCISMLNNSERTSERLRGKHNIKRLNNFEKPRPKVNIGFKILKNFKRLSSSSKILTVHTRKKIIYKISMES